MMAAEKKAPKTYWELVWRQFLRNRLAVAGGLLVWLLFTLAIFANVLANGYPIYAKVTNPHLYQIDHRGWQVNHRFLIEDLRTQPKNAEEGERLRQRVSDDLDRCELKISQMMLQLGGRSLEFAAHVKGTYDKLRRASVRSWPKAAALLEKQQAHADRYLGPRNVDLQAKDYYPLLRQITGIEVFFFCLYLVVLVYAFGLGRIIRAQLYDRWQVDPWFGGWLQMSLIATIPLAAALSWHALVPPQSDQTPYHSLAREAGATIRFLPVPYFPNQAPEGTPTNLPPSWSADYLPRLKTAADKAKAEGRAPYVPVRPHYLGTDEYGYDVLSRIIWGARISLSVGFVAVSIYITIGIFLGSMAGYFQGWVDNLISRIIEIMLCFPTLFLIIIIMAYFEPSVFNVMIVIGVTGWPGVSRLVRGEFLRLGRQEFVLAAQSLGISTPRIIFRHVLPNALAPVLVSAAFGIAGAILTESALSFLGIGVPKDTPSWGALLRGAQSNPRELWWLTLFPGFAVFLAVTSYNLVAEGVRDAIDPRLKE